MKQDHDTKSTIHECDKLSKTSFLHLQAYTKQSKYGSLPTQPLFTILNQNNDANTQTEIIVRSRKTSYAREASSNPACNK